MTDQAGPSNQRKPTQARRTARPEDGGRDTGRLRPNAPKPPTATIKLCKCFESGTGRNLIVCIDGTSNQFGINNTNVVELYSLIKAQDDEGREQLTFYNSGIGTYAEPSWKSLSYIMQVIYHKIDMAIAWNFERIIIAAYLWLAEQYQPGDRIYLFGFSRGAYQVRALAAMIDKVGLIKKGNQEQIPFAYQLYAACGEEKKPSQWSIWGTLSKLVPSVFKSSKPKPSAEQMAKHFREVFSRVVNIHFIGAWDTVSSVGTVRDKSLPGTTDGMHQACYFRHAMALDERRVKFLPEYAYGGTSLSAAEQGEQPSADVAQRPADAPNTIDETAEAVTSAVDVEATGEVIPAGKTTGKTTDETASATNRYIHTKEVWFAGTHSDIGGGNVENPDMDRARPPLRWMCFEAAAAGLRLHPIQRELEPGEKNEVRESLTWVWWLLELLPLKRLSYERTGTDSTRRPHCGAGRIIQKGQKIHCSLIPDQNSEQGDNVNTTYVPKACPPGEDREKFWESLRKNTTPDQSKVEYDWYDSVHRIVEDYKNPNGDADAKRKHLREIYDMAQSGEGQLALREAKVADVIQLPEAEGAQWFADLDLVMNLMERIAEGESLKVFGFRTTQRRTMPKAEGEKNQQIAKRFLRGFTNECLDLPGHDWAVSSVAFSPDGKHIVLGSWDNTIRIWDAHTGKMVGESLQGHTNSVLSVAFSPDGTRIISGSTDESIRIWDARTGVPVRQPLQGHTSPVLSVAFSPDGTRIVSGSRDETIRIWDVMTGEPVGEPLRGHTASVWSVVFSPDGTHIILGSYDKTIRIWDATTGELVGELLQGHAKDVNAVAFSSDGKHIVSGSDDKTIRIWDARTGEQVGEPLQGHMGLVFSVTFSPDGTRIVSGSSNQAIRIWDARTGEPVGKPLQWHTSSVWSVACSPDGTCIVSGSDDRTIRIWDARTGEPVGEPLEGHTNWVRSVACSPDGVRIVSGSADETVRIWDLRTGQSVGGPLRGHTGSVNAVAFSSDGKYIVSGSDDRTIRIWDLRTWHPLGEPLRGHTGSVNAVAFSSDGKYIVSGSDDRTIRIWDARMGEPVGEPLEGHTHWVTSVAFSPDGKAIASGSTDETVCLWDVDSYVDAAKTSEPRGRSLVSL